MRLALVLIALAACTDVSEQAAEPCTTCALVDANNYAYTSELAIGTLELRAGTDTELQWERLTHDIRGGAIDARADLTEARLIAFRNLTPDEVTYGLAHDALAQADVGVYVTCASTDARCRLSEFGMFGNQVDIQHYFVEGYGTWLLAIGQAGASGADALAFLSARSDLEAVPGVVADTTSTLDVDVDLRALTPVVVPAGDAGIAVEWSALHHDGFGDDVVVDQLDELWLGRFDEAPEDLERDIFGLEDLAEATWTLDVSGYPGAVLTALAGAEPFEGVDTGSTWVLALRCRACTNPAPRFLTLLEGVE